MRTLSKIGLAGLRVGFLVAHADIVHQVNKVRLPFNVNALSQKVAIDALHNKKQMRSQIRLIISERKKLYRAMAAMDGTVPFPTDANFILFRVADADRVYSRLLKKGVLVRNIKGVAGGCLRVTVGTAGENAVFLKALNQVL